MKKQYLVFFLTTLILGISWTVYELGWFRALQSAERPKESSDMVAFDNAQKDALPYFFTKDFNPHWINYPSHKVRNALTIPRFNFIDQNGSAFDSRTSLGKISVVNFFFTSCGGYCGLIMRNVTKVNAAYKEDPDVVLLSLSVTPDIDTPKQLNEYSKKQGITSPQWHLLTGDKKKIYALARNSFYADTNVSSKKSSDDFVHSESIYLLDGDQRIRGVYNGNSSKATQELIRDIVTLKMQPSS